MDPSKIRIEESWKQVLSDEFKKSYFDDLTSNVKLALKSGATIYPPGKDIFKAFELTKWDDVSVVILGQDPYHNEGEAMGLCFSIPKGIKVPPSLKNIYKELHQDIGKQIPQHGDLTHWAGQGVLLLNAILTVEKNKPGSHKKFGWQQFTDAVIRTISDHKEGVVFLLWGNYAKSKLPLIDQEKHHVLQASHPSPLARFGFIGCQHFSKCNKILTSQHKTPISW